LYPDYPLWRDFAYEYEQGKLAIDVINGGPLLRDWVDDARATPQDLDTLAIRDEQAWLSERPRISLLLKGNGASQTIPSRRHQFQRATMQRHVRSCSRSSGTADIN
jgi:hypothetical protein